MRLVVLAAGLLLAACGFEHGHVSPADATTSDTPDGSSPGVDSLDIDGAADVDTDGDTFNDAIDNCPKIANPDQRNWDHDARGDICDGCPHIADEGNDADGDGIPDACDPRPAIAGETRLLWNGFYDTASIAGWTTNGGTWAVSSGVLTQTSTNRAVLLSPAQYQRVAIATSVELTQALPTNGVVGACSGQTSNNSGYDCCEVVNVSGPAAEAATVASGRLRTPWTVSIANNAQFDIQGDTVGATNACHFQQQALSATQTATKDGANGNVLLWTDAGATAQFLYLFVVQIGS